MGLVLCFLFLVLLVKVELYVFGWLRDVNRVRRTALTMDNTLELYQFNLVNGSKLFTEDGRELSFIAFVKKEQADE